MNNSDSRPSLFERLNLVEAIVAAVKQYPYLPSGLAQEIEKIEKAHRETKQT